MIKRKNIKKKMLGVSILFALCIPILTFAATSGSAISGLEIAKYKLEGAQEKSWTDLPISSTSNSNSYDTSITKPGTTVVTLYVEDKAGNQNYQIKSFTITEGMEDAPVEKIEYKLTGATVKGWTTYKGAFTITNEGETYLEAKVHDEAGNVTTVKQTIRLDKTNPVNAKAVITLE
jgi:hypothetical protein